MVKYAFKVSEVGKGLKSTKTHFMDRPALPPVDVTLVRIPFIPRLGIPTSTGGKSSHIVSAALGGSVVVLEEGQREVASTTVCTVIGVGRRRREVVPGDLERHTGKFENGS